jgi:hypothetical protein
VRENPTALSDFQNLSAPTTQNPRGRRPKKKEERAGSGCRKREIGARLSPPAASSGSFFLLPPADAEKEKPAFSLLFPRCGKETAARAVRLFFAARSCRQPKSRPQGRRWS